MIQKNNKKNFLIQIKSSQNETWHGTIETVNQNPKTTCFRSLLEMIKFIDSEINQDKDEEKD